MEKETIYTEEVQLLMKGADYKEVIAYMEEKEDTHKNNPFASMVGKTEERTAEQTENTEE